MAGEQIMRNLEKLKVVIEKFCRFIEGLSETALIAKGRLYIPQKLDGEG
jgi:hypothetical protein